MAPRRRAITKVRSNNNDAFVAQMKASQQRLRTPKFDLMQMHNVGFLDRGMAAGIPDPAARARTITLYTDVRQFMKQLGIPSTSQIQALLLDRSGRVLWRSQGAFTPVKGEALLRALEGAELK